MNRLPVTVEHRLAEPDTRSGADSSLKLPEMQKGDVKYEYNGYQIRVHFGGDKTFSQCIRNLAERGFKD